MTEEFFDSGSARRPKRRFQGVLVIALTFVIVAGAIVSNVALQSLVELSEHAKITLVRIHGFAYQLSAMEWQAVSERALSVEHARSARAVQDNMTRAIANLERLDPDAEPLRVLRRNYDAYALAMNEEFQLIEAGKHAEARAVDRDRVDPAFDNLVQALTSSGALYSAKAKQLELLSIVGSSTVLVLAMFAIAALVWRTQRAQAAADKAIVEQRVLAQSERELRVFAENVPAMTISIDQNMHCRFANKAFAAFFGLNSESMSGKHLQQLVGAEAYAQIAGHIANALQGSEVNYRRTHKLASGESRYLDVRLLPHIGDSRKIIGCFGVTNDITEHKLAEERVLRVAHHDTLTGLPNRLLFNDRLAQTISAAKRRSSQFALLYVDLDRFKLVNDTLGHSVGDMLLREVAKRIREEVRKSDTVARVGGDEFNVILPDLASREEAQAVVDKIVAAISAPYCLSEQQHKVQIGVSIGSAVYPEDGQAAEALIKAADATMYRAKRTKEDVEQDTAS